MITTIDNPKTDRREMWEDGKLVDFMSRRYIEESHGCRLKWGYFPMQPLPTMDAPPAELLPNKTA